MTRYNAVVGLIKENCEDKHMGKLYALKGEQTKIEGIPELIPILPLGHVKSQKGDFNVDEESFQLMKDHMMQRGIDIVVDYEHQTLDNVQAPAGGWIKEIYLQDKTIAAKVEWTEAAKKYLGNKEYRYLSPVVLVRKADDKAIVLHSVALTNTPAIDGMFPIINSIDLDQYEDQAHQGGKKTMDLKALAKLLGLPEDSTEENIMAAIKETLGEVEKLKDETKKDSNGNPQNDPEAIVVDEKKAQEVVANKLILSLLSLKEDAKVDDVAAAIVGLKKVGGSYEKEFLALKDRIAKDDADKAVMLALKAGKISAAQKEWATEYALKDPSGFTKFVDKAPKTVPVGELELETKANKSELDESTLVVCKILGVSKEDIEKYGKENK